MAKKGAARLKRSRTNKPREMLLLHDWIAKFHPDAEVWTRVRIGPIPAPASGGPVSESERLMLTRWRHWCDAILIYPDKIIVVEAMVTPRPSKIGQLELYRELIPHTPELKEHLWKKQEYVLLAAFPSDVMTMLAKKKGFRVVTYQPAWAREYFRDLYPRFRRGPRLSSVVPSSESSETEGQKE